MGILIRLLFFQLQALYVKLVRRCYLSHLLFMLTLTLLFNLSLFKTDQSINIIFLHPEFFINSHRLLMIPVYNLGAKDTGGTPTGDLLFEFLFDLSGVFFEGRLNFTPEEVGDLRHGILYGRLSSFLQRVCPCLDSHKIQEFTGLWRLDDPCRL